MAEINQDKLYLQRQAENLTEREQRRIDSYRLLRYDFSALMVDDWLDCKYDDEKFVFHPERKPKATEIRKEAGISFLRI